MHRAEARMSTRKYVAAVVGLAVAVAVILVPVLMRSHKAGSPPASEPLVAPLPATPAG